MAASNLMESLATFTHPDETEFQSPFLLTLGGAKWSVATDRAWIVGVRGSGPYPPWETTSERLQRVTHLLTMAPCSAATVAPKDVLDWAGSPSTDIVAGRLCGILVDAGRVAELLADLPFKRILVWDATEMASMPCIAFAAGDRWKAILAGIEQDYTPQLDPFDPTVGRKLFDLVMDEP